MITITILNVSGQAMAQRKWPAVPGIGDFISIDSDNPLKPQITCVREILWRRTPDGDCAVDLFCSMEEKHGR
jgi:hypothetical protein